MRLDLNTARTVDLPADSWVRVADYADLLPGIRSVNQVIVPTIPCEYPEKWIAPRGRPTVFRRPVSEDNQCSNGSGPRKGAISLWTIEVSGLASNVTTLTSAAVAWSKVDDSTASKFLKFTLAVGKKALECEYAKQKLKAARMSARDGEMRIAYENAFRGLDLLLRNGEWNETSKELQEMCRGQYPAVFAIGAMRFASDASKRIPRWDNILESLNATAQDQKVDVKRAMRGLVRNNETI